MRVYTYHERPGSSALLDEPILIREGFSWAAAFFSVFWTLWHRLWLAAAYLLVAVLALEAALALSGADPLVRVATTAGLAAIIGYCANDWRRAKLRRQGFGLAGVVTARSMDAARRRWFDRRPADPVAAAAGA